ncbi:alpha-mannosidase 2-like [Mya arenaria]|uniref:alpha-mannosidase 2-like n=1 Tax=Mya arenaria TaxID=6604 RepID=UPI0022E34762|nr:alpha-mannosidase 2-like [Mya arenaria]
METKNLGNIVRKDTNMSIEEITITDQRLETINVMEKRTRIHTYRKYYNDTTSKILDLLPRKMKQYRSEGRLEIAPGGWVVPDEGTVPYTAYIDQLSEGRNWVKHNIGTLSDISLDLDQFVMFAGSRYMQRHFGVRQTVIKRMHSGIKEFMMQNQMMNFWWRQDWDTSGEHDTFVHVEPYDWLSFADSCGPDRELCSDLDLGIDVSLPDLDSPKVNETIKLQYNSYKSLDDFTTKLVNQLHLKSAHFKHKSVLLPLGASCISTESEWDLQYRNTKIIMDYINSKPNFKTNIVFGTMKNLFEDIKPSSNKTDLLYPVITGDFVPYANDPFYWSGYFTTRPSLKRLGREVQESVTATDIFLALATMNLARTPQKRSERLRVWTKEIIDCRHEVNIFQHHDSITGTSRVNVISDYEKRLSKAFEKSQNILANLLSWQMSGIKRETAYSSVIPLTYGNQKAFTINFIETNKTNIVLQFVNSYHKARQHETTIEVIIQNNRCIGVFDNIGNKVKYREECISENKRRLSFEFNIPAMGWVIYNVTNNLGLLKSELSSKGDENSEDNDSNKENKDKERRLNVFTNSGRGVTSPKPGTFVALVDRVAQLRECALRQQVREDKLVKTSLFLTVEKRTTPNINDKRLSTESVILNGCYGFRLLTSLPRLKPSMEMF